MAESQKIEKWKTLSKRIKACAISINDLRQVTDLMLEAKREVIGFVKTVEDAKQQASVKEPAEEAVKLLIEVVGKDGTLVKGDGSEVFRNENLPFAISKVKFDLNYLYQHRYPSARIFLDARKDGENFVMVMGNDITFVEGLFGRVTSFFDERRKFGTWIYGFWSDEIYRWIFIPIVVMLPIFKLAADTILAQKTFFIITIVLIGIWVISMIIAIAIEIYVKWLFPFIEFETDRPHPRITHKVVLATIVFGVLANFLYMLISVLIGGGGG